MREERSDLMDVTIIGAGNMGRGIGTRLVAGGNKVKILDHDPDQAAQLAEELRSGGGNGSVEAGSAGDRMSGDVVVLAVWYPSSLSAVEQYGDQLAGKIVVDTANPVDTETFDGLVTPPDSSAAEEIAKKAPGAKVVKAFNTTFASTLVEGKVGDQALDVFIAGDDEDAKETVAELATSGGLNPIDTGPLRRARELERLGFLHMAMQDKLGTGYSTAVKVIQPG
jgi:NADPH-dependent F420 reductase